MPIVVGLVMSAVVGVLAYMLTATIHFFLILVFPAFMGYAVGFVMGWSAQNPLTSRSLWAAFSFGLLAYAAMLGTEYMALHDSGQDALSYLAKRAEEGTSIGTRGGSSGFRFAGTGATVLWTLEALFAGLAALGAIEKGREVSSRDSIGDQGSRERLW